MAGYGISSPPQVGMNHTMLHQQMIRALIIQTRRRLRPLWLIRISNTVPCPPQQPAGPAAVGAWQWRLRQPDARARMGPAGPSSRTDSGGVEP